VDAFHLKILISLYFEQLKGIPIRHVKEYYGVMKNHLLGNTPKLRYSNHLLIIVDKQNAYSLYSLCAVK